MKPSMLRRFESVNKELWVVLTLFIIAFILNHVVGTQRMVLSFFVLPTLGSAYFYGRRHATLTAFASVLLVTGLLVFSQSTSPQGCRRTDSVFPVARTCRLGRHADRDWLPDGHAVRA